MRKCHAAISKANNQTCNLQAPRQQRHVFHLVILVTDHRGPTWRRQTSLGSDHVTRNFFFREMWKVTIFMYIYICKVFIFHISALEIKLSLLCAHT